MSLAKCLKRLNLSQHEGAILRGAAKEHVELGHPANEAARLAVQSLIDDTQAELDDLVAQVGSKVPGLFVDSGTPREAAPAPNAEGPTGQSPPTPGPGSQFWQSIGVSSFPKNWEVSLEQMIGDLNKNNYKYILEHHNVLSEKIYAIYEFMKMHFLSSKLVDIQDNIMNKEQAFFSTSKTPLRLPKTETYDKIAIELSKVINDRKAMSFMKRMEDIKQDINDTTLPILRVFHYGTFDAEIDNASTVYNRNNSYPSKSDILQNESLWLYLSSLDATAIQSQVYKDCITRFRDKSKTCIQDFDVTKYIKENLDNGIKIAKKATNVFLSIKEGYTLDTRHYLPRFVAASSRTSIEEVLRLFQNSEKPYGDFPLSEPKTILPLPNLQNIMVFYDEKTGLVPLDMISYADRMKKVYDAKPKNILDISDEQWKIRTRAYVPEFKSKNEIL